MSNLAYNTPYQLGAPGAPTVGGGGDLVPVTFRDNLDAMRSGAFTPEAQYPDGYLGNANDRRSGRLLKDRLNDRSYERGVHKGEQLDPSDYNWPDDYSLLSRLQVQAQAVPTSEGWMVPRAAPSGTLDEQATVLGQALSSAAALTDQAPNLQAAPELRRVLPSWR